MTAAADLRPDDVAEENSHHKGELIAEYLYRAGLTIGDVAWLPYTDRHGPSRTRLARAAYRTVPDSCPRAGDHSPPSSATSESWRAARTVLDELEALARLSLSPYGRDLLDEGRRWRRPVVDVELPEPGEPPDDIPADIPAPPSPAERAVRPVDLAPYTTAPALITCGSLPGPAPARPRGWDALAALGPLDPPQPCRWCGQPAVVGTLNGWRCAAHPPVRSDPRGDWGWAFDWTPKAGVGACLRICWCGRCPHYDPSGNSPTR